MGFSFHGHKRDVDKEKHLKRLHTTTPLIESPLTGADQESLVFSQRHEANTLELFFDLFFVANLATFTTYHSITDSSYLIAYVGFFGILWSTWFQVTLHDVRFARDSLYERVCKMIQFIVFVGLALVGSSFNPTGKKANNTNFRILCYTLVISRGLLVIQYVVVLFFIFRAKYSKLYLPLGLMIFLYAAACVGFGAMTPAFKAGEQTQQPVYIGWYVIMGFESVGVIAISSVWRMMSFKKTHLMERMSLLTLIVIGEGAIGVTKTVSRLMGKYGLEVEGCFLVMCIIAVLVLIWALYFDNFPHGHYGTIRQQIWSLLHFPLQLAIVGVVEGSQQVALARFVIKNWVKIDSYYEKYCLQEHYDGKKLREVFMGLLNYWNFPSKLETYGYQQIVEDWINVIGNSTGICSAANTTMYAQEGMPAAFGNMTIELCNGVYLGLGMKLPVDKLETYEAAEIAIKSWKMVYIYYWSSFAMLILCSIVFLLLIRRHKVDLFDWVSLSTRAIALVVGLGFISLVAKEETLYNFLASSAVLPACLSLLFTILLFDKLSAVFCNWRLKKSGEPYAVEKAEEHHHGGGHGGAEHGEVHDNGVAHHASGHSHHGSSVDHAKAARWSIHGDTDTQPLVAHATTTTEYGHDNQSYAMSPLMSPPIMASPPIGGHVGGYAPLGNPQHYGA